MSQSTAALRLVNPDPLPLTVRLVEEGWTPGAPDTFTVYSVAVDAWTAARLVCPGCNKTGMKYVPFRRAGACRVAAVCPKCGAQEEV